MKFLFVHQNFPGQYLPLIRMLLSENDSGRSSHLILFITENQTQTITGVTKIIRPSPPAVHAGSAPTIHRDSFEFDRAMKRSATTYFAALRLQEMGFKPDIIIGHHGWGELLAIRDVFQNTPVLGYFEFFYHSDKNDVTFDAEFPIAPERLASVRAKNAVNLLALSLNQHGQTPTNWQKSTYPDWSHQSIKVISEGVDLDNCFPDDAMKTTKFRLGSLEVGQDQKLITYVARDLEPYRGFHTLMRSLPQTLRHAPEAVIAIVGGDGVSYGAAHRDGSWKEVMLRELAGMLDLNRVYFLGKIPYKDHISLLKRSNIHLYLSYPFVASWSLREAIACGCSIVGFNNEMTREFISNGQNGLLIDSINPNELAKAISTLLADPSLSAKLGSSARFSAELVLDGHLSMTHYRRHIDSLLHSDRPETGIPEIHRYFRSIGRDRTEMVSCVYE